MELGGAVYTVKMELGFQKSCLKINLHGWKQGSIWTSPGPQFAGGEKSYPTPKEAGSLFGGRIGKCRRGQKTLGERQRTGTGRDWATQRR